MMTRPWTNRLGRSALAGVWIAVSACALARMDDPLMPAEPAAMPRSSLAGLVGVGTGERFAFALYNEEGRLIHSPIDPLRREIERRRSSGLRPITDIFVLSHGWNFTLEESARLWENYRLSFDQLVGNLRDRDPDFEPFLIFVAWSSVTRPISSALGSLSPYELPDTIGSLTRGVDAVLFHLPSNWGETQDAFTMAIGARDRRSFDPRASRRVSAYATAVQRELQRSADRPFRGYEVPVSVLLDELVSIKFAPDSTPLRIHAIGHSFGAKVISLAVFDAVARLLLSAESSAPGSVARCTGPSDPAVQAPDLEPCASYIDSMVLLNAAIKPQEMYEPLSIRSEKPDEQSLGNLVMAAPRAIKDEVIGSGHFTDFARLARSVPRKAIVYSSADSATGWLFGFSQILLDYEAIARMQDVGLMSYPRLKLGNGFRWITSPFDRITREILQVYSYGAVFAAGFVETQLNHATAFVQEPFYIMRRMQHPKDALRLFGFPIAPFRAQWAMGNRGLDDVDSSNSFFNSWLGTRATRDAMAVANRSYLEDSVDCPDSIFFALSERADGPLVLREDTSFFTFDAGLVYTGLPENPSWFRKLRHPVFVPPGAHGDVRAYDAVENVPKRERTLNFLYRFTRGARISAGVTSVHAGAAASITGACRHVSTDPSLDARDDSGEESDRASAVE